MYIFMISREIADWPILLLLEVDLLFSERVMELCFQNYITLLSYNP